MSAAMAMAAVAAVSPQSRAAGAPFLAVGFCVILVALGAVITLSALKDTQHISRAFLWILIGCCFGLLVGYQRCRAQLRTGLPPGTVRWIEGRLLTDAVPLKGGRGMLQIEAHRCGDGKTEATASGSLTVFLDEMSESLAGEKVLFDVVHLHAGEDGNWISSSPAKPQISGPRRGLGIARAAILTELRRIVHAGAGGEGEFLTALLLGIREDPADPFVQKFRRAGVSHVLALSGMHLGIVTGFVLLLARPILGTGKAYLLTLPLLLIYIWIVGPRPSILRAGIMYVLMSGRICGHRRPDSLSVLSAAFICGLLIDPSSMSALSFQLSFLALFGIMTIGASFTGPLSSYLPKAVAFPLAMSLGAQFATAPVVLAQFGVLRPIGVVTSIVISPLIVLYLWAGICFVLLSLAGWLTGPMQFIMILCECSRLIMDLVRRVIGFAVTYFAQAPGIEAGAGAAWSIGAGLLVFVVWRRYLEYRYKSGRFELSKGHRGDTAESRAHCEEAVRPELLDKP